MLHCLAQEACNSHRGSPHQEGSALYWKASRPCQHEALVQHQVHAQQVASVEEFRAATAGHTRKGWVGPETCVLVPWSRQEP
eukprot:3563927-Alexandrium_andersonii.AAC.1